MNGSLGLGRADERRMPWGLRRRARSIRGAISTLRSKKGLAIEATVIKNVGPNAKGGTTRYHLPTA